MSLSDSLWSSITGLFRRKDFDRLGNGLRRGGGVVGLGNSRSPENRAGQKARGRPGPDQTKVSPEHRVGPFRTGPP